jgi:AcrR family transcriptional regulator
MVVRVDALPEQKRQRDERKLAKRVGYAPMSVYSYFADKQDILFALAEDAFKTLARRIEDHPADDPIEALQAVMTEYAAFGLGNMSIARCS